MVIMEAIISVLFVYFFFVDVVCESKKGCLDAEKIWGILKDSEKKKKKMMMMDR